MALSVLKIPQGFDWPLGYVNVANNGTPVNIMVNVDANNVNAPASANGSAYTPRCHRIFYQGFRPGNNNNGMVANTGNVYILRALGPGNQNGGGPQNRADSGAMVGIIPPGGGVYNLPADERDSATISPYAYTLDADVDGEGALVTLIGAQR